MLPSASTSGRAVGSSHSGLEHWRFGVRNRSMPSLFAASRSLATSSICCSIVRGSGAVRCAAMRPSDSLGSWRCLPMFSIVDRWVASYLLKSSAIPDVLVIARGARGRWACTVRGDRLRAFSARSERTNAEGDAAQPRKIFLPFKWILKQNLRTTRPTAPRWKAHIQICADRRDLRGATPRRRARRAGRASWVWGSAPKSSVAAPG